MKDTYMLFYSKRSGTYGSPIVGSPILINIYFII
jgi:hypothetical protein